MKPSVEFIELEGILQSTTLYLVSRSGPCVFSVKDDNDKLFKVVLGNPHLCSCNAGISNSYCVHSLFCLIKVLRIPACNPLCFQSSLTDYEINQVVNGMTEHTTSRNRRIISSATLKSASKDVAVESKESTGVNRQPLDDDQPETCPICQDDMTKEQALTWCRAGCGNNLHAKCMLKFSQFKQSNRQDVSCPFCR
jgi:E3 ubiquitin-protein ligase ZSWIM2